MAYFYYFSDLNVGLKLLNKNSINIRTKKIQYLSNLSFFHRHKDKRHFYFLINSVYKLREMMRKMKVKTNGKEKWDFLYFYDFSTPTL